MANLTQFWPRRPDLWIAKLAARELESPPSEFGAIKLDIVYKNPEKLLRVSSRNTGEPHFGFSGVNRFDAPGTPKEFGACYLGCKLSVAFAESVLHDEMPISGEFHIAQTELDNKYVVRFYGKKLRLANLTGARLKRAGGHAGLSGSIDYSITQQWSLAVFNHPSNVDGFVYMSRHVDTDNAVILFDRAASKISMLDATRLVKFKSFASVVEMLGIVGI